MGKKIVQFLTLLLVVTLFSSCSPLKLKFSSKVPGRIEEVALISTYLNIQLPALPLIDAAVMNGKTNSISNAINQVFEENINIMRDNAANVLQNKLRCKVIYGEVLHGTPGFKELKEKYNLEYALATGKDNFPEIVYAKDDINPFEFKNGKPEKYFQDPNNYMSIIAKICEGLNVDYIAVSQSQVFPMPGSLIISASLIMYTYLYLFDKEGTCIASGRNCITPAIKFKPIEVEAYQQVLDTHSEALRPIVEKIAAKYGN